MPRTRPIQAAKAIRTHEAVNRPLTASARALSQILPSLTPLFARRLPRSGQVDVALPSGAVLRLWSRGDDFVANQIYWHGWDGHEPETARHFWDLASVSPVVIDVGAHVGYYSLLASLANPSATVVAVEPLDYVYTRLMKNLEINGVENVTVIREALGASGGTAPIFHVGDSDGIPSASSLSESFMRGAGQTLHEATVEVSSLDDLVTRLGLSRVDLIKMDTETTEPEILQGGHQTIDRHRPTVICEVLPQSDTSLLDAFLTEHGYRSALLTDRGPEPRPVTEPHPTWRNFLLRPRP